MAKNGFKVIDSDMHIIEPPDLWLRYIDAPFKSVAPVGHAKRTGELSLEHPDGRPWGRRSDPRPNGTGDHHHGRDRERIERIYKSDAERGWTSAVQLEAMGIEGIDIALIYPSRGLHVLGEPDMDPKLAAAIARAYNDWLYDFCQLNPDRLMGVGMISVFDINDAVAEARRSVQELGFRGVFIRPNEVGGRNWHDPYYEPLWSTLEELDVPVGFHEAIGTALGQVGEQFRGNFMLQHTYCHPVEMMLATGSFCAGGILARHPLLRVAFLEGNCSWLPWLLWRLDEHWERVGEYYAPDVTLRPSEYFKRQAYASVECDEEAVKYVIDFMGDDRIVFSTDYPHGDSKYPNAVDRFLQVEIPDENKKHILWDNCASVYKIGVGVTNVH